LISRINRKYAGNRLLSEEKYSGSGNLVSKSDFRYDSRNKLLNRTVFYQNEYQETNYAYRAGEKFESDNEFNYRYKFNINGRISNKKTYKGISFTSETHFYYNDYGNVITVREIDKDGTVKRTLYDYIYDSNNNWTLCVEYDSADNIFVHKREIIYYN
jgi:hypothetical protein